MKKLIRKNLDELARSMLILTEDEQIFCIGRGNGSAASPFTEAEFDAIVSSGAWNGGYVE